MTPSAPASEDALEALLVQGVLAHQGDDLEGACLAYTQLLQLAPGHSQALQLLATIEGQRGHVRLALGLLRQAVLYNPQDGRAQHSLGRALQQAEDFDAALLSLQRAVELLPGQTDVLEDLAGVLYRLLRLEDALTLCEQLLTADPQNVQALRYRGEILQRLVRSDPSRRDETIAALRDLQPHVVDAEGLRYTLAAMGAAEVPPAMPGGAVARLFDAYADTFDAHLVGVLAYRTPELIGRALLRDHGVELPRGLVVDLGCGTGLCAPFLRPLAAELVGVDLSTGMLTKAHERGLYDRLARGDLMHFMRQLAAPATHVVAADVFVYIGDLDPVFAAVVAALQPGGLFAFSVEETTEADYQLQLTRRYAHSARYIERLALQHGLDIALAQEAALRKESGVDVAGIVYVLRRG